MKKGTFRKALGVAAVLAVTGVIVMLALSPRREGFCPGLFRCGSAPAAEERPRPEIVPVQIPDADSDSLPTSAEEPVRDTLTAE